MILLSAFFGVVSIVLLVIYISLRTVFTYKEAKLRRIMKRDRKIYEARELFLVNRLEMELRKQEQTQRWN